MVEIHGRGKKGKNKKKRFRFEEVWLQDEEFKRLVEKGWARPVGDDPCSSICGKILHTRNMLLEWSHARFGKLKQDIEMTRAQLAVFFDRSFSAPPTAERLALESKLNDLLQQEQIFWKQRAKVFWLTDGDLNTNFFHQHANNRRKKNFIKGLFNKDGVWCTEDEDLEGIVLNYFRDLFSSSNPPIIMDVVNVLPKLVTDEITTRKTPYNIGQELMLKKNLTDVDAGVVIGPNEKTSVMD